MEYKEISKLLSKLTAKQKQDLINEIKTSYSVFHEHADLVIAEDIIILVKNKLNNYL